MAYQLNDEDCVTKSLIGVRHTGNVVCTEWSKYIGKNHKKWRSEETVWRADLLAMNIYADIVYWYSPTVEREEKTGEETYYKKYKADMLQKSYTDYLDLFGQNSIRPIKDAIVLLEQLDLIKRDVRKGTGKKSRLYISLNVKKYFEITFPFGITGHGIQKSTPNGIQKSTPNGIQKSTPTYNTITETTLTIDLSPSDLPQTETVPTQENKEPSIEKEKAGMEEPEILTDHQRMTIALAEVMNVDTVAVNIWKRYGRLASDLLKNYTPEQIKSAYADQRGYWKSKHTYGINGQYPNERLIRETVKTAVEYIPPTELTSEVMELENYFESLTNFLVPPLGSSRQEEWTKPCSAILNQIEDVGAAKKLMDAGMKFAKEKGYTIITPKSLYKIVLINQNGHANGSAAKAIEDTVGGYYV